ncbi:exodeoxyribonuclease V subunit gamma, partial [Escherichia coli]|uniref:exodeoxyribonuclease V subunit gamma n=1 Tax=Escherichia coli TaxID=562 RepID=UPI00200D59A5
RSEVFDWLMLAPLYESFGLNLEQMTRACELLTQAGFIRGFDELHLQQTLSAADDDYRYTFAYALERLVAGVMMPKATVVSFGEYTNSSGVVEKFVPLTNLTMADADIVAVLCDIYQTLDDNRHLGNDVKTLPDWLSQIERLIQQKFSLFNQTNAWRAIFAAQNDLKEN